MPIFEFVCEKCTHRFEILVRTKEVIFCPHCRGKKIKKIFSTFATSVSNVPSKSDFPISSCGGCGDPRGPGACRMEN